MSIESRFDASKRELIVSIIGDFNLEVVDDFRAAYRNVDPLHVRVDMSRTQRMDSSGLGMLLNMRKSVKDMTCITIVGSNPYIRRILSIAKFESKFDIQ